MDHNHHIVVVAALLAVSCSPKVIETIRTETITEYRDSIAWRDTTIFVPIPLESDQAIVHVGDTSHRETTVAESDAWVDSDGMLHHTLRNKRVSLSQGVKLPEHFLVTNVKNTAEHAHVITREVERELTAWQRFRINSFWWLCLLLAVSVIWIFRKPIVALIKKLI